MSSLSVDVLNMAPSCCIPRRSFAVLTMLPLWATATYPSRHSATKGCALTRLSDPVVEYRL